MITAARWTAADDATLVRLIGEGASAAQIGKEIGRSRSAVCGRAHRKNLHFKSLDRPVVKPAQRTKDLVRFSSAEDKIIIEMAAQGKSGADIGDILRRNKSSVVQRARRLGAKLNGKDGPKAPKVKAAKPVKLHPGNIVGKKESRAHDPAFSHVTPVVAVDPLMVALVDLRPNMCRFPVGDPRNEAFGFCGHPKEDGSSYCKAHRCLCHTAPELRRKAA